MSLADMLSINAILAETRLLITTTRAGCRCENMVFVFLLVTFTLRVRYLLTYRAFEGCIVRTSIALPFIPDLDAVCSVFFTGDSSFKSST